MLSEVKKRRQSQNAVVNFSFLLLFCALVVRCGLIVQARTSVVTPHTILQHDSATTMAVDDLLADPHAHCKACPDESVENCLTLNIDSTLTRRIITCPPQCESCEHFQRTCDRCGYVFCTPFKTFTSALHLPQSTTFEHVPISPQDSWRASVQKMSTVSHQR